MERPVEQGTGIRRKDQQQEILEDDGKAEGNEERRVHVLAQDAVYKEVLNDESYDKHCGDDQNQCEQRAHLENAQR